MEANVPARPVGLSAQTTARKTPAGRRPAAYPNLMMTRSMLVAALLAAPFAAHAQKAPSCVCDSPGFHAITPKAEAAAEYWQARRKAKVSTIVSGTAVLFSLLGSNQNAMAGAIEEHEKIRSEMFAAKAKAEKLGALKVTGDDLDGGKIEFKLEKGVDYSLD
jgi:hypothetical protein